MTYCPIPRERCVKYFHAEVLNCDVSDFILLTLIQNLLDLKIMARATQNPLACHFGHACHRFANAGLDIIFINISYPYFLGCAWRTDVCPRSSNAIGPESGGLQTCDLTRSYNFV